MTTTEPTNNIDALPTRADSAGRVDLLAKLAPQRRPVDTTVPVLPETLRDRQAFNATARVIARRNTYRAKKWAFTGPLVAFLLIWYAPRGLGRIATSLGKWVYDQDSANMRRDLAGSRDTLEYTKVHAVRKANLQARCMVLGTCAVAVLGPVLAWAFPHVLAWLVGAAVFIWIVKLIPGRGLGEIAVGAAVGAVVGFFLPFALELLPQPPAWTGWAALTTIVLGLGWHGRPQQKPLVKDTQGVPLGVVEKPSADKVLEALCYLGIAALTPAKMDKFKQACRVIQPGVARSRNGYHLALELPWGVTAGEVMDKRDKLAGALNRELASTWPSQGPRHPSHLMIFLSDEPMATARQARWPLLDTKTVDIFNPIPVGTDQQGRWVDLLLAYKRILIGGASGSGKSFLVRELALVGAADPRARLICMDGKSNGDLDPLRPIAHGFYVGAMEEEIEEQVHALRSLEKEMLRRARFLRSLPAEINTQNKVTSQLVDMFPDLAPYVLIIDEIQEYTQAENLKARKEFIRLLARFARLGRSAGVIPIFATQYPDSKVIPTAISSNCTTRFCLRVQDYRATDMILGTGSSGAGLKAELFTDKEIGLAWHKDDGREPLIVRSVFGLDAVAAEEVVAKLLAVRKARGLLTGAAAGEEQEADATQRHFLEDALAVFANLGHAAKLHLAELAAGLADLQPGVYGHTDTNALGGMLRSAGVKVKSVHRPDKGSQKGVELGDVQRAAADAVIEQGGDEDEHDSSDSDLTGG